jgi:hypothetical protein
MMPDIASMFFAAQGGGLALGRSESFGAGGELHAVGTAIFEALQNVL